jgi:hypothetical protein
LCPLSRGLVMAFLRLGESFSELQFSCIHTN